MPLVSYNPAAVLMVSPELASSRNTPIVGRGRHGRRHAEHVKIDSHPAAPSGGADAARAGPIEFHVLCVMKTACARPTMEPSTVSRPDRRPDTRRLLGVPVMSPGARGRRKGGSVVDYAERLRRLVINDACFAGAGTGGTEVEPRDLDPKTLALVRLAALVAVGGAVPSY